MKHLVFYDGECGLCDHVVQLILKIDKKEVFCFAPLQGSTAKQYLSNFPEEYKQNNTLILIENFQSQNPTYYIFGKAALKIFWIIGGIWSVLGLFSFLPSFLYDWIYKIVAKYRHRLFKKDRCFIPNPEEHKRFLP